jgi:hypothetical protein
MSKRVLIQYSVELTEVPERVSAMMVEISNTFADSAKKARQAAQEVKDQPVGSLRTMSELAKDLKKKQVRVEEFMMILVDYMDTTKALAAEIKEKQAAADKPAPKKKKKATKKKEQE